MIFKKITKRVFHCHPFFRCRPSTSNLRKQMNQRSPPKSTRKFSHEMDFRISATLSIANSFPKPPKSSPIRSGRKISSFENCILFPILPILQHAEFLIPLEFARFVLLLAKAWSKEDRMGLLLPGYESWKRLPALQKLKVFRRTF